MKKDNLNTLFKSLEKDFDIEMPDLGHEQRFLNKLNPESNVFENNSGRSIWRPFVGIAASIALLISLFIGFQQDSTTNDLASISPEMANTQSFFTNAIAEELDKLEAETSPKVQILIKDAMIQMEILENDYEKLI